MNTIPPLTMSLRALCLAGVCILAPTLSAQALLMDFEAPGYVSGNSLGGSGAPGGSKWSGSSAELQITAGAGSGGSQALVLQKPPVSSVVSNFVPSADELPDFDPTESTVRLDFSFRYVQTPESEGSGNSVSYLQIGNNGSNPAARITFYSNGTLGYHINNANPQRIPSNVFQITDSTTRYQASILLDYKTKTYSVSIDGTQLTSAGVFRGTEHNATLRFSSFDASDHKQIAFDSLSVSVIPEPGSASLLLGGASLGALLLKSRNRSSSK